MKATHIRNLQLLDHKFTALYKNILDDDLLLGFIRGKKFKVQTAFDCVSCCLITIIITE